MILRSWLRPVLCNPCLLLLIAPATLVAQKADLSAGPQTQALQIQIDTKIATEQTRKMLIDGEEPDFGGGAGGGGFGGGGSTSTEQRVVFIEGPAGEGWREYKILDATSKRPGRDGEAREDKVAGGLAGKRVRIETDADGGTKLTEEGDDTAELGAELMRGVPARTDLAGLLPGKTIEVGEAVDLGANFLAVLRGLSHPVTPARPAAADDEGDGGRGRGQGGRGGRGRGGFAGMRGAPPSPVAQLIRSDKLKVEATAKLVEIKDVDGRQIAVLDITASLSGKGTGEEMGMGGMFGGRGGFGGGGRGGQGRGGQSRGGQAAANGTDNVSASVGMTGRMHVDLQAHLVTRLELEGKLQIDRKTTRTIPDRDGGDDREMESTTDTKGTLRLAVTCQASK